MGPRASAARWQRLPKVCRMEYQDHHSPRRKPDLQLSDDDCMSWFSGETPAGRRGRCASGNAKRRCGVESRIGERIVRLAMATSIAMLAADVAVGQTPSTGAPANAAAAKKANTPA